MTLGFRGLSPRLAGTKAKASWWKEAAVVYMQMSPKPHALRGGTLGGDWVMGVCVYSGRSTDECVRECDAGR